MLCSDCVTDSGCKGHGTCNAKTFKCSCKAIYTGTHCETKLGGKHVSDHLHLCCVLLLLQKYCIDKKPKMLGFNEVCRFTQSVNYEDTFTLMIPLEMEYIGFSL